MEGRHELVLGVERHLGAPLERIPRLLRVGAHLRGEDDQGGLGRVADDRLVIGHRGVAAQREPQRQAPEIGKLRAGHPEDRAGLAVAAALHLEPISAGQHRGRGHLVQRQRPGLVAVDHGRPAERLDVGERFHDRLRLGQPLSARGQHRLHECRQAHRDRGNRGRDAQQHHGVERLTTGDAEDRDHRHRQPRHEPEHLRHPVQLFLQGRPLPLRRGDHVGDPPHLRRRPRRRHHHGGRPTRHLRVLEHQVGAVAEHRLGIQHARPILRHRRALTGQRRLLELQGRGGHDPAIRRDDVTGLEQGDITRHQLRRFDLLDGAIAAHPGMRHLQLRECLDAGPRLQLLGRAHHHVERHQAQHEDAGRNLPDDEARHGDDQQHDVHRVGQLSPRHLPHARGRLLRQLVRAVLAQPPLDLAAVQPLIGIDAQLGRDIASRSAVPHGLGHGLLDRRHLHLRRVAS